VGETLKKRLRQARFESPVHEAMLNLLVAAGHLRDRIERVCAEHDVTHGQYNVLRILKGAPDGHARCDIARRLLERAPDVTRLIDRLEHQGLVERSRSEQDRRLSLTRITRKGLRLLEAMRPGIDEAFAEISTRLSVTDAKELSRICEALYDPEP
jgi:DNA-binding MarR family transcriptional regulator